ncbi:unnamed protein product [Cunninghamella blakesleeana]
MASTLYNQTAKCQLGECRIPLTWVSQPFLYIAWRTIYWTSFCLTWMFIPMMQAYVNTGEFKIAQKLKTALSVNIRFYMIYIVVGIFGLVYLVFKGGYTTREKLQGFVMAMANSWGLFLVIMFMGYGLVSVPRTLWNSGNIRKRLDELYIKAPRVKEECIDSELEFNELAKTINAITHRSSRDNPTFKRLVEQTIQRFPFVRHPDYNSSTDREHISSIPQTLTEDYIITLNRNMILANRMKHRKLALWKNLLSEAFYLQDIELNKNNSDRIFHSSLRPLEESSFWLDLKYKLEWWWVIVFRSIVYRGLAILATCASICILWSELTFNFQSPMLSIVGLVQKACGLNYAAVEVFSFLTLMWMCICVYTSLFKVRFFNLYVLIPHHHTDPNSLLWFTGYMCKMMAPLCYNYINLLGNMTTELIPELDPVDNKIIDSPNTKIIETVFSRFMGHINLVPFLGTTFIDWFPILILVPVLSAFFNTASSSKFFDSDSDNNDRSNNHPLDPETGSNSGGSLNIDLAEGKELVMEERKQLERNLHPESNQSTGLLNRAKSAFGSYSAKYRLSGSQPKNIHHSPNELESNGVLAKSLRHERDRHLNAILQHGNKSHINNHPGEPSSSNRKIQNNDRVDENDGALNIKWQNFGDNVKNKFGQIFTSPKNGTENSNHITNRLSFENDQRQRQQYLSEEEEEPQVITSIKRPTSLQGSGRVFGKVKDNSAPPSVVSSRAASPNPFQKATNAKGNQQATVSPFARLNG